jgi:YkoY family integral membrane protein
VFGQTYSPQDLGVIALLVLLEGLLSIDNALVLALLARQLPKALRNKALTYGLAGSFVFRFIAIGSAQFLLHWRIVKLVGGAYLVYISVKYFLEQRAQDVKALDGDDADPIAPPGFWPTVARIELTDIAFAVDSILAAIALVGSAPPGTVGPHPKLWVVVTGGMLGVMLMRVAAAGFIKLLERFPRLETTAYLLVLTIGVKLLIDWGFNSAANPERVNFQDSSTPAFWIFWSTMLLSVSVGFIKRKQAHTSPEPRQ